MTPDLNTSLDSMIRSMQAGQREFLFYIIVFGLVQVGIAFLCWWFIGRPWQNRVNNLMDAATRYFNAMAAKNGGGNLPASGYPSSTSPQQPPPTPEELRAQAYKSVAEIERRYGQKK